MIAAAGSSRRFGSDKLAATLGGRTVLEAAVAALGDVLSDAPLVVVTVGARVDHWRSLLAPRFPNIGVIAGGPRRQDSVRLGVEWAVARGAEAVAVHDGATPFVHPDDIRKVIDGLSGVAAAVLCAEIPDTVKRIDCRGFIAATVDRSSLRLAQTPQVIRVAALERAWRRQDLSREWSDEAALLEADGWEVRGVVTEHRNPKLTTPDDLAVVRRMVATGS